ncbi:HK97 gp10 family phage protein [Ensifer sp. T173]|uniref:HK97 gp10 family phage protein n=1 Tax=Ensifer canadensis TaxID=555315 RepID=A0AAW4FHY5_9HYPH|nr:HK97-gp10 family putative phage morphogenesis protein [Ensifer canadensis]MBM3089255.1 HK97 gp10 family phage protein [Ensifer canadensis]UBI76821.1 HK97 gp10 family phage protein [Ensifer canadensis]
MSRNKTLSQQSAALSHRLSAIPKEVLDALRPALIRSGEEVATNMRALAEASRDTGALVDSITVTGPGETTPAYAAGGGKRTANANQVLVTVGNEEVRHGHLVEFGTVKTEAQPFMLPGFRLGKPRIERRISRAITNALKQKPTND